jgi:hypothetical protein
MNPNSPSLFPGARLCLALLALTASARAQTTVDYNAAPGLRNVTSPLGTAVPDGNEVRIGYFADGFDVAANLTSLGALEGAWTEYGSTTIRTLFGQPGRFAESQSSSNPAFDNRDIYVWILQTGDNSAPSPTLANVTAQGLYSSTAANWNFPAHDNAPPANLTTVTSGEVMQAFFGSILGDASTGSLQLAAVPEISAFPLVAAGLCLGLVVWRRREPTVSNK